MRVGAAVQLLAVTQSPALKRTIMVQPLPAPPALISESVLLFLFLFLFLILRNGDSLHPSGTLWAVSRATFLSCSEVCS